MLQVVVRRNEFIIVHARYDTVLAYACPAQMTKKMPWPSETRKGQGKIRLHPCAPGTPDAFAPLRSGAADLILRRVCCAGRGALSFAKGGVDALAALLNSRAGSAAQVAHPFLGLAL